NLDEMDGDIAGEEITLDEIPQKFGNGVLYFPDNDEFEIDQIIKIETGTGTDTYHDLTFEYKQSDAPLFTFTVLKASDSDQDEMQEFLGEAMEREEIRGEEAIMTDAENFRSITWQEGNYHYTIMPIDPDLSWKEVKVWAD